MPESLTPAPRLMADSSRSPSCAAMLMMTASTMDCQMGSRMCRTVLPRAESSIADVDDAEAGEDASGD